MLKCAPSADADARKAVGSHPAPLKRRVVRSFGFASDRMKRPAACARARVSLESAETRGQSRKRRSRPMSEDTIVWIGADVHAASITLARLDGDSANAVVESFPNESKVIKKVFGKLAKEGRLRVCYEAGPCGYELA